ncbi:MAG: S8 family serine peptidase [Bacteroidota bacterium]
MKFLIIGLMLYACQGVKAQGSLKLMMHNPPSYSFNPDSVKVDTLSGKYYAKNRFYISFDTLLIRAPWAPDTSTLMVNWNDIDSLYPNVRNTFRDLSLIFGSYTMQKEFPEDTAFDISRASCYHLTFNNYIRVDSLINYLNSVQHVRCIFDTKAQTYLGIPNDQAMDPRNGNENNNIGAGVEQFKPHKSGAMWSNYYMKLPMAWEITRGRSDRTIVFAENGEEFVRTYHPDMVLKDATHTDGNILYLADGGDGDKYGLDARTTGHVFQSMSAAIAKGNNAIGMTGTCQTCTGAYFSSTDAAAMDVDGLKNKKKRRPDVWNISMLAGGMEQVVQDAIKSGVIVVAGSPNGSTDSDNGVSFQSPGPDKLSASCNYVFTPTSNPYNDYRAISVTGLADGALNEKNGSQRDFGTQSGRNILPFPWNVFMYSGNVQFGASYGPDGFGPYGHSADKNKFDISTNTQQRQIEKQQAYTDLAVPANYTLVANRDNISQDYMMKSETSYATPRVAGIVGLMTSVSKGMGYLKEDIDSRGNEGGIILDGENVHKRAYNILTFTAGKVPDLPDNTVSSVSRYNWKLVATNPLNNYDEDLNNPIQYNYTVQSTDQLRRSWAQRVGFGHLNAFRAVAHSIHNKGNTTGIFTTSATLNFLSTGPDFTNNYNAASENGYKNEDGKKLMHFGAFIKEGTSEDINANNINNELINVIQPSGTAKGGGMKFPDKLNYPAEPDYKNNNGRTQINGVNIQLTVPENSILAIDGILTTNNISDNGNQNDNSRIITNAGAPGADHGKILVTGFLDGVDLKGRIKVDDIIVYSDNTDGTGLKFVNHSYPTTPPSPTETQAQKEVHMSEVYGHVQLRKNGLFVLENNVKVMVRTGAVIDMQGNKDIVIKSGATLELDYNSIIKGSKYENGQFVYNPEFNPSSLRKIVVEDGGTLKVLNGARAEILCPVEVKSGGLFVIGEDAKINLRSFNVAKRGEIKFMPGAQVALMEDSDGWQWPNECFGRFTSEGTVAKPIKIMGQTGENNVQLNTSRILLNGRYGWRKYLLGETYESLLKLKYTNFDYVSLKILTVPKNNSIIEKCNFTTSSTVIKAGISANNPKMRLPGGMLYMEYDYEPENSSMTGLKYITLKDCNFTDMKTNDEIDVITNDQEAYRRGFDIAGVVMAGFQQVVVQGCTFNNLREGLFGSTNVRSTIIQNTFTRCNTGIVDRSSALQFCSNSMDFVTFGNVHQSTYNSSVFNNTYNKVGTGIDIWGGATHQLRNNQFINFNWGIFAQGFSRVEMNKVPQGSVVLVRGVNDFIDNIASNGVVDQGDNPFTPLVGNLKRRENHRTDIVIDKDADVILPCGYNKFASETEYHARLHPYWPTPAQPIAIPNQYNAWRSPGLQYAVRPEPNRISLPNTPINTPGSTAVVCGYAPLTEPISTYECTSAAQIVCGDDPYPNDGSWPSLTYDSPLLTTYYQSAKTMVIDNTLGAKCRREKAYDALEAALLMEDTTTIKLTALLTDFHQVITTTSDTMLITSLSMLSGEIYERLGQLDSAKILYNEITDSYPASPDSIPAAWNIQYIDARLSDTLYGSVYDSSMLQYNHRVLRDLSRFNGMPDDTLIFNARQGNHQAADQEIAYTTLEQNIPNPYSDRTEISFTLASTGKVRLVITDILGNEIAVIVNDVWKEGRYTVPFETNTLPSNVYYYRLETAEQVLTKKMTIVK